MSTRSRRSRIDNDRHKTTRKPITIQLSTETDNDLITALDRFPAGKRSEFIKEVLRRYLAEATPGAMPNQDIVIGTVHTWLTDMQQYLAGEFTDQRTILANMQIAPSMTVQGAQQPQTAIDAAPKLSDEDIARRNEKMKKQKGQWT